MKKLLFLTLLISSVCSFAKSDNQRDDVTGYTPDTNNLSLFKALKTKLPKNDLAFLYKYFGVSPTKKVLETENDYKNMSQRGNRLCYGYSGKNTVEAQECIMTDSIKEVVLNPIYPLPMFDRMDYSEDYKKRYVDGFRYNGGLKVKAVEWTNDLTEVDYYSNDCKKIIVNRALDKLSIAPIYQVADSDCYAYSIVNKTVNDDVFSQLKQGPNALSNSYRPETVLVERRQNLTLDSFFYKELDKRLNIWASDANKYCFSDDCKIDYAIISLNPYEYKGLIPLIRAK